MSAAAACEMPANGPGDLPGLFVAIVGPSGAGKDTLIAYAASRLDLADLAFLVARRVVTRQADATLEDHDSLTAEGFAEARRSGKFALDWDAHGLSYGIPVEVEHMLRAGGIVLANLSRAAIPSLRQRYRRTLVVEVSASASTRAARLAGRGREDAEAIASRLARADIVAVDCDMIVTNDATVAEAGQRLVDAVMSAAATGTTSA